MILPAVLDLGWLRGYYAAGGSPRTLLAALDVRIAAADPAVFITRTPAAMLEAAIAALLARAPDPGSLPLWGVPFAVKDNIDVAGLPTTCACPALSRVPARDAFVVARLVEAGAIVIGKTNLDQFATGLNGTRSPYGAPRSVFSDAHISGGSSSGSAVAVAAGLCAFSLGTDTAGSGRVPAAFNNIVGIKPTPGLLSNSGLVPACRSLDCISVFALGVADGGVVRQVAEGFDAADPYSRKALPRALPLTGLRVGILPEAEREFFGDDDAPRLYREAIERLGEATVEIDYAPFRETAALLYEGPWVAERQAAFDELGLPDSVLDPSVAAILSGSAKFSAVDVFAGQYRLEALRRQCAQEMARVDVLLLPTTTRSFTVEEMRAEPVARNAMLGLYTNFCNLLGLAAVAVPAGFGADGLPFGITLVAPAFTDEALLPLADRLHRQAGCGAGVDRGAVAASLPQSAADDPPERLHIAVVGAHLSGMALNGELLALGGQLEARTRTSGDYRLFVLPNSAIPKPGLVHAPGFAGDGIALEVWSLPIAAFARFVEAIPAPLGIGKVELVDGSALSGFLCEAWALETAEDITHFGGWRGYCGSGGAG